MTQLKLLTQAMMFDYQRNAIMFQTSKSETALWLDMGLGKTIITLSSIRILLDFGMIRGVLLVAPVRVCRLVWRQEALKWEHTYNLTFSAILGTKDQRSRALLRKADIYLVNYENLEWLAGACQAYFISKNRPLPFDGLVWDELSKCKNSTTNRVRAVMKVLDKFVWRTGLTGTPASNGYKDLHGQFLVLDGGKRLGKSKTQFKTDYFHKEGQYVEIAYANTEDRIKKLIGDMTLEMSAADYNPLPDLIVNDVVVELPDGLRQQYERLEKEFFLELDSGDEIEVFNQASLMNKLIQFSNGAVYKIPGMPEYEIVHQLKLDALETIVEETGDEPLLLAYNYKSDAECIMNKFRDLRPINLTERKTDKQLTDAMDRWKSGDCKLMIGHPASMSHGIDGLQKRGRTLIWYGLNWSLDLTEQFNARIRRQGQGAPVICHRILCEKTVEYIQVARLRDKSDTQLSLRKAVNDYRKSKENLDMSVFV